MQVRTLCTFGDSILDCGRYNEYGLDPGRLLVRNRDDLFPEFAGQDLSAAGEVRLEHRAADGAVVADLLHQAAGLCTEAPAVALVTVGGNDLLLGDILDERRILSLVGGIEEFLRRLPVRPVLIGNVYDPTFGNDALNFLGVDPVIARRNHARFNAGLGALAGRYGRLVDLHRHFLGGDPSWYANTIEPSLRGASEIRRCFLRALAVD